MTVYSIRLSEKLNEIVTTMAEENNTSVSKTVSEIIDRYANQHNFLRSKSIILPRELIREIFRNISEDSLLNISKMAYDWDMGLLKSLNHNIDYEEFLTNESDFYKMNSIDFSVTIKESKRTITSRHDLGKNWSIYESEFHNLWAKHFDKIIVESEIEENFWSLTTA